MGQLLERGASSIDVGHEIGVGPPPIGVGQPETVEDSSTDIGQDIGVGPPPGGVGHPSGNGEAITVEGAGGGVEIFSIVGSPLSMMDSFLSHTSIS